jgi:hypothetical protein
MLTIKPDATEPSMTPVKLFRRSFFTKMIKRMPTSCSDVSCTGGISCKVPSHDNQGLHLLVLLSLVSQGGQDGYRPGVFSCSPREIEKRFSGQVSFLECCDKYVCVWSRGLFFRYCDGCKSDEDSMS